MSPGKGAKCCGTGQKSHGLPQHPKKLLNQKSTYKEKEIDKRRN